MQRLDCTVKNYAWGKNGEDSEVARLFADGHDKHVINSTAPYAELWMGTHPDGPAKVRHSSENLSKLIATTNGGEKSEIHLPFIMKIMSIKHSLSLQVHPTKEQAAKLHQKDPINYPDAHHKPELAYALTKFELLCGFRPPHEIVQNLQAFPELRQIMGPQETADFETVINNGVNVNTVEAKQALKRCFANLLYYPQNSTPEVIESLLESFYAKLEQGVRGALIEETIPVLDSMRKNFAGDVGCFSPLFLNHMILEPGECCFYAAEELHAYLSGECVECVGCSNNTIRAALTPKYIDREALLDVLNYRMTTPDFYLVPARSLKKYPNVTEYTPECKDFILHKVQITKTSDEAKVTTIPAIDCPSIMVVVKGSGECETTSGSQTDSQAVQRGDIFYIPPNHAIQAIPNSNEFLAYRTFSYEVGPDHSKRNVPTAAINAVTDMADKLTITREEVIAVRPRCG